MPQAAVATTVERGLQLVRQLRQSTAYTAIALSVSNWRPGESPYASSDVLGIALCSAGSSIRQSVFLDIDRWRSHKPAIPLPWEELLSGLRLVAHNDSFLCAALGRAGIPVHGDIIDIHKLAWLLNPDRTGGYSLKQLVRAHADGRASRTPHGHGHGQVMEPPYEDVLTLFGLPLPVSTQWDGNSPWPGRPFPPSLLLLPLSGLDVTMPTLAPSLAQAQVQGWEIGLQAEEESRESALPSPPSSPQSLPPVSLLQRSPATRHAWLGHVLGTAAAVGQVHEGLRKEAERRPWRPVLTISGSQSGASSTLSSAYRLLLSPLSRALARMEGRGIQVQRGKAREAMGKVQREIEKEEQSDSAATASHDDWELEWSGLQAQPAPGEGNSRTPKGKASRVDRLKGIQELFLQPLLAAESVIHPSYHITTPSGLPVLTRPRVLDGFQSWEWEGDMDCVGAWHGLQARPGHTFVQVEYTDLPMECARAYSSSPSSPLPPWSVRTYAASNIAPRVKGAGAGVDVSPQVREVAGRMSKGAGGAVQYDSSPAWLARVECMCWDIPCGRSGASLSWAWHSSCTAQQAQEAVQHWWKAVPAMGDMKQRVMQEASSSGYVRSLLGRPLPPSPSAPRQGPHPHVHSHGSPAALAVSASMADVLHAALARMQEDKVLQALEAHPLMLHARHGTLVLEVPHVHEAEACTRVQHLAQTVLLQ